MATTANQDPKTSPYQDINELTQQSPLLPACGRRQLTARGRSQECTSAAAAHISHSSRRIHLGPTRTAAPLPSRTCPELHARRLLQASRTPLLHNQTPSPHDRTAMRNIRGSCAADTATCDVSAQSGPLQACQYCYTSNAYNWQPSHVTVGTNTRGNHRELHVHVVERMVGGTSVPPAAHQARLQLSGQQNVLKIKRYTTHYCCGYHTTMLKPHPTHPVQKRMLVPTQPTAPSRC